MQIRFNLDPTGYTEKPKESAAIIRNRLCRADRIVTAQPESLIEAVQRGQTFTPGVMSGTSGSNWLEQSIFCVDIDNSADRKDENGNDVRIPVPLEAESALSLAKLAGVDPYFAYWSFRNRPDWPKYRLVFIVDSPVKDSETAKDISRRLAYLFNSAIPKCADRGVFDAARYFFGGRAGCVFYRSGTVLSVSALQCLPAAVQAQEPVPVAAPRAAAPARSSAPTPGAPIMALENQFKLDKESFDLASFVEQRYGAQRMRRGTKLFMNPCPICGHNDCFNVSGAVYHCFSTSDLSSGSVVDLVANAEHVGIDKAMDIVKYDVLMYDREEWRKAWLDSRRPSDYFTPMAPAEAPATTSGGTSTQAVAEPPLPVQSPPVPADYTVYFEQCRSRFDDDNVKRFLRRYGISEATARVAGLGFDPMSDPADCPGEMNSGERKHPSPRIIVPVSSDFYAALSTDPRVPAKFFCAFPRGSHVQPFGVGALHAQEVQEVFVVDTVLDALAVREAGYHAVALFGSGGVGGLLAELEAVEAVNKAFILSVAGDTERAQLQDGLRRLDIENIVADICVGYDSPSTAALRNREAFLQVLEEASRETTSKPDNSADYIRNRMAMDIAMFGQDKPTGFPLLDKQAGGLYPGLYVLAAVPSLGKTTFAAQMADQLAERGTDVLFFSLEMSRLELVSKSIARQLAMKYHNDPEHDVTSLAIRKGALSKDVLDVSSEYANKVGGRVSVIEGNFNCDVAYIKEKVRRYIEKNSNKGGQGVNKPVVFIDYLQIIRPPADVIRASTKDIVDAAIVELKRMSRDLGITVVVVSSINRNAYTSPISFESLKESGGIEYGCDVCWGLQLQALRSEKFASAKTAADKWAIIREAKSANPRKIEFVCLKNRFGRPDFSCYFDYDPRHDLFTETLDASIEAPRTAGRTL